MGTRLHGWRKLAGSSWRAPNDPQFFGDVDIDAAELLAYIDHLRDETGEHVSVTHLVGRAVAHGLTQVPGMNVRLAHGREYPREHAAVFFIVSTDNGRDLSGIKVDAVDTKSAIDVSRELTVGAEMIEDGTDTDLGRAKRVLAVLPPRVLRVALDVSAWLTSDLNLDLPRLGMRRQSFGSAMVTSVGMWGVSRAYSPLARYYRVPVLVLVGAVTPRPVAVAGRVTVRAMLTLTATFDHRYLDGFQAASFAQAVHEYLAHPEGFEPPAQRPVREQGAEQVPATVEDVVPTS